MKALDLETFFRERSVSVWGCADLALLRARRTEIASLPGSFRTAVVYGLPLAGGVLDRLEGGPDPLYLHHYRQANYLLDRVGFQLALALEAAGFVSLPVPASQVIDWERPRGFVSHRHLAAAAGLGWFGRNNLLVTPGWGSRLRLASVLTAAVFPGRPAPRAEAGCGDCRECAGRCPAGAIGATAADFDAEACYRYIKQVCRERNIGQHICGLCLCPFGDGSNPAA
ncbi:MAG TPA: epoxyqueuosine reductase [bacterium]|uniref:Epoxyqueuosine reductase n=1 Tax=candidate division TA06 bacterium ADurb.Bin417 TaxID=1852828 RepID=A0A1V5MJR5_UNCT6|nr:MAG: Epoxyqueuosine reductase [candidate division TA06 bacterium ADurb.Bin417]HNQ34686.1 epoxyqueuosine reductase [bacterium]HNS48059.1 epoxyqueuosine reductase [bacterium]